MKCMLLLGHDLWHLEYKSRPHRERDYMPLAKRLIMLFIQTIGLPSMFGHHHNHHHPLFWACGPHHTEAKVEKMKSKMKPEIRFSVLQTHGFPSQSPPVSGSPPRCCVSIASQSMLDCFELLQFTFFPTSFSSPIFMPSSTALQSIIFFVLISWSYPSSSPPCWWIRDSISSKGVENSCCSNWCSPGPATRECSKKDSIFWVRLCICLCFW